MATYTDPVCGMAVDDRTAHQETKYQGRSYYFCCDECKRKFDQNPQQYLSKTVTR